MSIFFLIFKQNGLKYTLLKKGILVLFYLYVFSPLWSQENVSSYIISGTVTDSLGMPVSGATVVLRLFETDSANVVTWGT